MLLGLLESLRKAAQTRHRLWFAKLLLMKITPQWDEILSHQNIRSEHVQKLFPYRLLRFQRQIPSQARPESIHSHKSNLTELFVARDAHGRMSPRKGLLYPPAPDKSAARPPFVKRWSGFDEILTQGTGSHFEE